MSVTVSADLLHTHFDYTRWATMLLVDACRKLSTEEIERDLKSSHGGILGTLRHIYFADRIWYGRFAGAAAPTMQEIKAESATMSLDALASAWPPLIRQFQGWIVDTGDDGLLQPFSFRTMAGDAYTMPRYRALLHVVNHATMHRGQIMTMLRQLGHAPPSTDLLFYYRAK